MHIVKEYYEIATNFKIDYFIINLCTILDITNKEGQRCSQLAE